MKVKIVVINEGKEGTSCEVHEFYGTDIKIEISEQRESDAGVSNKG